MADRNIEFGLKITADAKGAKRELEGLNKTLEETRDKTSGAGKAAREAAGEINELGNAADISAEVRDAAESFGDFAGAAGEAGAASSRFGGLIGALGGPIGIACTAISAAAMAWKKYSDEAEAAAAASEATTQRLLKDADEIVARYHGYDVAHVRRFKEIAEFNKQIDAASVRLENSRGIGFFSDPTDNDAYRKADADLKALIRTRNQLQEMDQHGGTSAFVEQANAYKDLTTRYASNSQKLSAALDQVRQRFSLATKGMTKDSAEYKLALEAFNRATTETEAKFTDHSGRTPARRRAPTTAKRGHSQEQQDAQAYATAMQRLIGVQEQADASAQQLSRSQIILRDVMASHAWDRMPETWRALIQAQARQTEATAAYETAMCKIDAAQQGALKSSMDLSKSMAILYDLMMSPAWSQMSERQRVAAVDKAEQGDKTEKEVGSNCLAGLTKNISSAISRGLQGGFSNGADFARGLAESLQSSLMSTASKGLSDGLGEAIKWASGALQDLFSSSGGSSSGGSSIWGSIASAIGSYFASAKGNAFSPGGVVPFAAGGAFGKGDVLRRPTFFKFSSGGSWKNGVAGEAGPEAALPLKRMSNGNLGVYADGGNGGVSVSITVITGGERNESSNGDAEGDYMMFARRIEGVVRSVITTEQRPGGMLAGVRS